MLQIAASLICSVLLSAKQLHCCQAQQETLPPSVEAGADLQGDACIQGDVEKMIQPWEAALGLPVSTCSPECVMTSMAPFPDDGLDFTDNKAWSRVCRDSTGLDSLPTLSAPSATAATVSWLH